MTPPLPDAPADAPAGALRVVAFTVEPAPLMALNELMRAHHRVYQAHVRETARCFWAALADQGIRPQTPGFRPLRYVEVRFTVRTKQLLDADNKVVIAKAPLDALKLAHPKTNPHGLGVITDDSDGEHGNPGFVRRLEVQQVRGVVPALSVELREVAK